MSFPLHFFVLAKVKKKLCFPIPKRNFSLNSVKAIFKVFLPLFPMGKISFSCTLFHFPLRQCESGTPKEVCYSGQGGLSWVAEFHTNERFFCRRIEPLFLKYLCATRDIFFYLKRAEKVPVKCESYPCKIQKFAKNSLHGNFFFTEKKTQQFVVFK